MRDVRQGDARSVTTAQVVIFGLAGGAYAMDIRSIEEVIELQEVTEIPAAESWVEGTTLFRDQVVPVVNLGSRLGLDKGKPTEDTRIVVVRGGNGLVGLLVDAVSEVVTVPRGHIEPLADVASSAENGYVAGVVKLDGHLICLVDVEQIAPAVAA